MIIVKLYFCFLPLLVNFQDTSKKEVTIIGEAFNGKDGAWILSKDQRKSYLLEGIDEWDEKIEGKQVKVWGKLVTQKIIRKPRISSEPGVPPPPIPQVTGGDVRRTILNAKWKLIDG